MHLVHRLSCPDERLAADAPKMLFMAFLTRLDKREAEECAVRAQEAHSAVFGNTPLPPSWVEAFKMAGC